MAKEAAFATTPRLGQEGALCLPDIEGLSTFRPELKNRGMHDCLVACCDGLSGLPEAIESVFPEAQVQLCIVHQVRNSLKYVVSKERKQVASDLRAIYTAATLDEAELQLEALSAGARSTRPRCGAGGRTGSGSRRSSTSRQRSGR